MAQETKDRVFEWYLKQLMKLTTTKPIGVSLMFTVAKVRNDGVTVGHTYKDGSSGLIKVALSHEKKTEDILLSSAILYLQKNPHLIKPVLEAIESIPKPTTEPEAGADIVHETETN